MKNIYLSLMLLFAAPLVPVAQTVVQVGNATTTTTGTGESIFGTWYEDNVNMLLFTAAELNAAGLGPGMISGVAFNVTSVGSPALTTMNIEMGPTTFSQWGNFWQNNLTPVYSANNLQPTVGWNVFTFTTPYIWNGVDNLVIKTCFDNTSYSSTYGMEYTSTSFPSNRYIYADQVNPGCDTSAYPTWAPIGNSTMRMNTQFYWAPSVNDDVGVAAIDSPFIPACSFGNALYITLENLGSDTLFSATINWSVNGITQTPVSWSDTIAPYMSESGIFVSTFSFSANDTVTVWANNPNGVTGTYTSNDTATVNLIPALNGVYNIGGPGADYYSFSAAASDLNSYGVCGPVTFMVNDSTYNEQVSLGLIDGVTDSTAITFMSTSGDSSLSIITSSTSSSTAPATIMMSGAKYITFKGFTIENTSINGYNYAVDIRNGSGDIKLLNNIIQNPVSSTTSNWNSVIYGSGTNHNVEISNNHIKGGSYSIYWYGSSANPNAGLVVSNNIIDDPYYAAIYTYYTDAPVIEMNKISAPNTYMYGFYGVYLSYANGAFRVNGNQVANPRTSGYGYPFYIYYASGSSNDRGIISNNTSFIGDDQSNVYGYAFYMYGSTNVDFLHNSSNVEGTSSNGMGAYFASGGGIKMYNNSFVSQSGYGFYNSGAYVIDSDNNNFYSQSGTMAYYNGAYSSMSAWQNGTGFDMNGVSVDPMYADSANLHSCNDTLDNAGKPVGITTDVDGEARSASKPDIGADEFVSANPDLGPDTTVCDNVPFSLELYGASNASLTWSTGDVTPTINISFPATYWVDVTSACGTGSDTIVVSHKSTPTPTFTSSYNYLTGIFTNTTAGTNNTYMWDFGDGGTSTEMNPLHVFPNSGTYNVTLYVTNECGTDSIVYPVGISVGVSENTLDGGLSVYPNPTNGSFTLNLAGMDARQVTMTVVDLNGRTLAEEMINVSGSNYSQQFDFNNVLSQGMYFIKVQDENGSAVTRLTVQ